MNFDKYFWQYILVKYPQLDLLNVDIFSPTATTQAVFNAAVGVTKPGMKILDLGCGSGVIGIGLLDRFDFELELHFSDLDVNSVRICKRNLKNLNFKAEVRLSDIFENWDDSRFDLIINDVSGVPPIVSEYIDWFRKIPNASGEDGTALTEKVIKKSKNYLVKDGLLITPIISLCRVDKVVQVLTDQFSEVKLINTIRIPLNLAEGTILSLQKIIPFATIKNVGPMYYFETYVYACK